MHYTGSYDEIFLTRYIVHEKQSICYLSPFLLYFDHTTTQVML
jgi:hypothetical protein